MKPVTATDIVEALAVRHKDDVFVPQCKNGPTHSARRGELLVLDALAINRSWASACVFGYEIKVRRSDFTRDTKWQNYPQFCNRFFFAAPKGLISPDELPHQVGLVELVGKRLLVRRQAIFRDDGLNFDSVFRYILMARVRIDPELPDRKQQMLDWLAEKEQGQNLAHFVSQRIQKIVSDVTSENHRLSILMENYDDIRQMLTIFGFNPDTAGNWYVKTQLDKKLKGVEACNDEFMREMKDLREHIHRIEMLIQEKKQEVAA